MDNILLELESEKDFHENENVTREAFWNLNSPGCNEHFFMANIRKCNDFIKELNYVAKINNKIIGNIMYTKSHILDENLVKHETITFGPISVLPEYQRKGVGGMLINHTMKIAKDMGYRAIIIFGSPKNYCKFGFKSSKDFNIVDQHGKFPYALLVFELYENSLKEISGIFKESKVFENFSEKEFEEYDKSFPPKEKEKTYTQEIFKIESHSFLS